jgi:argonaute-like protein implicated in RNA metabolism and viral defense
MTTYCLEMRSTQNWQDVRYREYTTSSKKADLFKQVPKIKFTDSGHGIIPVVKEHSGRREPRNMMLQDHVLAAIIELNAAPIRELVKRVTAKRPTEVHGDVIEALTQAQEYFENRSDVVDGSYGEPSPNREMSLAQLCKDALARVSMTSTK